MQVGFIGLGIMGRPMAVNLARAGHALLVPGYKRIPDDIAAAGAVACGSAKEIAQRADVVIVITACAARGGNAWDHSALVRALELLASHELGSDA